jgi:effector-binding domain-containing protein
LHNNPNYGWNCGIDGLFTQAKKKSQSADIEISIKIKCDSEKTASEKNKIKHK